MSVTGWFGMLLVSVLPGRRPLRSRIPSVGIALCAVLLVPPLSPPPRAAPQADVKVGSKVFTESVIIGEIATQLAGSAGTRAEHRRQLGGTRILWNALLAGEIDAYHEYTGTIAQKILAGKGIRGEAALREAL